MWGLLKDFHRISGIRIGLFDTDGNEVIAYPKSAEQFCDLIRSTEKGREECLKCDRNAFEHGKKTGEVYIYNCHAGMSEMTVPIMEQGELLGFLMIGQIRTDSGGLRVEEHLTKLGIDSKKLSEMYDEMPIVEIDTLNAYARVLEACAVYAILDKYIRAQQRSRSVQVDGYIVQNLRKQLNIPHLCRVFKVGKTTLCREVKERFGMSVGELIRTRRIEAAQILLQKQEYSIAEISYIVGMDDYNYFSKVFKKHISVSPSVYRRLCREEGGK